MKNNFWTADYQNGAYELTPLNKETETIADTTQYTPEGAYTTFRTYDRCQVLRLTKHLDRLEETSRLAGFDIHLDRAALRKTLIGCIDSFSDGETKLRITIDLTERIGLLYIAIEELHVPSPEQYQTGIETATARMHRENPKAKLSNFLSRAEEVRSRFTRKYPEILMYNDEGDILEGLSSNFYGVQNGVLITAEEGVLSGTTRDFVLKIAREMNIPLEFRSVKLCEVHDLDEAFITSTSRSILPIREIDNTVFETVPGPITNQLMNRFAEELDEQKEQL